MGVFGQPGNVTTEQRQNWRRMIRSDTRSRPVNCNMVLPTDLGLFGVDTSREKLPCVLCRQRV